MVEKLDEDTVMLDDDDECMDSDAIRDSLARPALPSRQPSYSKRHASFDTPREVPFPYPFYPDPISRSTTSSHAPSQINPSGIQPAATADDGPQRDRIDGLPLTHQDQPPAYENVDANNSPSAHHRASRPLPPVPTNKGSVYGTMQSSSASDAGPSTESSSDAANHASYQHQDMSQHNGPYNQPSNALFPFGRPFSSPGNATQPMVPPGRFAPPNPSLPGCALDGNQPGTSSVRAEFRSAHLVARSITIWFQCAPVFAPPPVAPARACPSLLRLYRQLRAPATCPSDAAYVRQQLSRPNIGFDSLAKYHDLSQLKDSPSPLRLKLTG
ncbi:hypothetical protein EWM64_g6079 [Hericium alpestre]|uniref:Uncharacterized protein n=1 Tax=Hericium alpestre TaxID=135208 RepID=A0A4Y9ZV56_9AGAM|nr:hypothetical protein EWM64_g6079 [Hericium alpestre]